MFELVVCSKARYQYSFHRCRGLTVWTCHYLFTKKPGLEGQIPPGHPCVESGAFSPSLLTRLPILSTQHNLSTLSLPWSTPLSPWFIVITFRSSSCGRGLLSSYRHGPLPPLSLSLPRSSSYLSHLYHSIRAMEPSMSSCWQLRDVATTLGAIAAATNLRATVGTAPLQSRVVIGEPPCLSYLKKRLLFRMWSIC
jgi:hypothetical protein